MKHKLHFLIIAALLNFLLISFITSLFSTYSNAENIKSFKWKFATDDVDDSIIFPTKDLILLVNKFAKDSSNSMLRHEQKELIANNIYIVGIDRSVLHKIRIYDYIHSIEISPSGEYVLIATMNDIPQGRPTKGKVYCYDKEGNKKWEKNIWGKPYASKKNVAINFYQKLILDPNTEERKYIPGIVKIFNYNSKEIFRTKEATRLAALSQDGEYLATSYRGKTSLFHVPGQLLWTKDIEGYVSFSRNNSLICIGERKIDKKEQKIQCLTKEGKNIWTEEMNTIYGAKIAMSSNGEYIVAYPSGIEYAGEGEMYIGDKKAFTVYNKMGQKLWFFKESNVHMGSFKQILISDGGSVAVYSDEYITKMGMVEKNDWIYFFNKKGEMIWKTNKIGENISMSEDGRYLVTGPYFYDTQK